MLAMTEPTDLELQLEEARALIRAAYRSTDNRRMETLFQWAHDILEPLARAKVPAALWLTQSATTVWGTGLGEAEFEAEYQRRLREAADAGDPDAQFQLACE